MTNLTPVPALDDVVQNETSTLVLGGVGGPMNTQAQQLLNRTEFLNDARVALSNLADPAKGAAMIGRGGQVVRSIAELKALSSNSPSKDAFATGFYEDIQGSGGGPYRLDTADTISAEIPGVNIIPDDNGGRWKLTQNVPVTAKQMGVIADVFDAPTRTINDAALLAARNWVAANSTRHHLLFTEGVYAYNTSPNWAIQNAVITTSGEVRLRYFGTGNAVIIDLGPTINTFLFNVTMGPFIVEAPSAAQHGVYVRSIHHSRLIFKVRGAGTNYAGIKVDFAVCTDFSESTCYPNDDGNWYLGAKPKYGLHLDKRNAGEQVSYCTFDNTIWEGLDQAGGAGILLEGTLGNIFKGGTAERCNHGVISTFNAIQNRFYGTDFEANIARDILDDSQGNEYHGVDSAVLVTIGNTALFPSFFGGTYQIVEISAGSKYPLFSGIKISRFPGGGFIEGEPTTIFRDCLDIQTQKITPFSQANIIVTASPFAHTNTTGNAKWVSITGGTVTALAITRGGVTNGISAANAQVLLAPNDLLTVTYSAAPTIYSYSL